MAPCDVTKSLLVGRKRRPKGTAFSNPYRCLSLTAGEFKRWLPRKEAGTTWTGSGNFPKAVFYDSKTRCILSLSEIWSGISSLTVFTCSTSLLGLQITLCDVIKGTGTPFRLVTIIASRCSLHLLKPPYFWPFIKQVEGPTKHQEATMQYFYCRL